MKRKKILSWIVGAILLFATSLANSQTAAQPSTRQMP
jgi:hypothetical protein